MISEIRSFALVASGSLADRIWVPVPMLGFGPMLSPPLSLSCHQGQGGQDFSFTQHHLIDAEFREAPRPFFCKSGHRWVIFSNLSTPLFFKCGFWSLLGFLAGSSRGCSSHKIDC